MNALFRISPWAIVIPIIVILLFSLVAFLTNAPISMVTQRIKTLDPKIGIQTPTGNFWNGQTYLFYEDEYLGLLRWDLDAISLFLLSPKADVYFKRVDLNNPKILIYEASGQINLISDGVLLSDAYANINLGSLAKALPNQYFKAEGFLRVSGAVFQWTAEPSGRMLWHIPTLATAKLAWPGGEVGYEVGGIHLSGVLPALAGDLRGFGDLNGRFTRQDDTLPLVTGGLTNTGVLVCNVHYGLTTLLKIPNPDQAPPEKVYFQARWDFSQVLLR